MNITYLSTLILASAMLGVSTCIAAPVGKVFLLKGDAVSFTDANPQEIKVVQNAPVQSKDILRTESNANLEVGFLDATSCKLGPSTELSIEEYQFVRGQQNSTFKATLKKGKATFATGTMVNDNPENFKITTPSATVGVRGCLFDLEQQNENCLVVNVLEVGKTNEPCIFITTFSGVRHEFKAPGYIIIHNNRISQSGVTPLASRSGVSTLRSGSLVAPAPPGPSPLLTTSSPTMPITGVIQNEKPPKQHYNSITYP